MRERTGPTIVPGMFDQAGARRIALDIAECSGEVGLIERAREEVVLPTMPGLPGTQVQQYVEA